MADQLKFLPYRIYLESPVLITSSVGDPNIALSEDFIAGTSLLGLFANRYISLNKTRGISTANAHLDPDFKQWFLSDEILFLNGYKLNHDSIRSLPIPLSIQFPKGSELPQELLFKSQSELAAAEETKPRDGFCVLSEISDDEMPLKFEHVPINKQINFHHQRTDQLVGKSESGEIFNYESLNPDQTFEAMLVGTEKRLEKFIKAMGKDRFEGRVGRSKNTQYGRVMIDWRQSKFVDGEITNQPIDSHEFSMTLLSHTILLNEYGQSEVGEEVFKNYLIQQLDPTGKTTTNGQVTIESCFVRTESIENYVSVWKLRKPAATAFRMGSCFRIIIADQIWKSTSAEIKAVLLNLQNNGIGIRRNEGFGRIAVNWQQDEDLENLTEWRQNKYNERLQTKPEGLAPEMAKQIFQFALKAHLIVQVREQVALQLEKLKLPPRSSTQISRLLRLLSKSPDEISFLEKLGQLKQPAKDKLNQIIDSKSGESLLDFLAHKTDNASASKIKLLILSTIDALAQELKSVSEFSQDERLLDELYKTYLETLLTLMQKKLKLGKEV